MLSGKNLRIHKAKETMTSKERVLGTLSFDSVDRVPLDYSANPGIHRQLKKALGAKDNEALLDMLGVDFRAIDAPYVGPALFDEVPGCTVHPEYGYVSRWVQNAYGGYEDCCFFPLQGASDLVLGNWPVPNPDHYHYEDALLEAKKHPDKAIVVGHPGYPDIINSLGRVMGMEDCLINLHLREEATLDFIRRKADFELGKLDRLIETLRAAGHAPDILTLGEDLGTQLGPMISRELFCDVIKPVMARFIKLAQHHSMAVMVHSCGSSSWVFEDFIGMGVHMVDALQPEAAHMSPLSLAARFGGRLAFHGCISTAALASMSAIEVQKTCEETLGILMPTKGYCLAPTHMIQDNTPPENIIAMYQTAHKAGVYE